MSSLAVNSPSPPRSLRSRNPRPGVAAMVVNGLVCATYPAKSPIWVMCLPFLVCTLPLVTLQGAKRML